MLILILGSTWLLQHILLFFIYFLEKAKDNSWLVHLVSGLLVRFEPLSTKQRTDILQWFRRFGILRGDGIRSRVGLG